MEVTAAREFESYLVDWLESPAPVLPPAVQKIGSVEVEWWPVSNNTFHVIAEGPTSDRKLAEVWVSNELEAHGLKRATYEIEGFTKARYATWGEVMEKAKRLIQTGKVHINKNGYHEVDATVEGDTGTYHVEISRQDPSSRAITYWKCTCPWGQVSWGRTRQWKRFEGRSCSHNIAAFWLSLSTPLEEDNMPGQGQPEGPQGQPPGGAGGAFGEAEGAPGSAPATMPPGQGPRTFDPNEPAPGQAYNQEENNIIPPFPGRVQEENEIPPYTGEGAPPNPLTKQPPNILTMGRVAADEQPFVNGEMVQIKEEEIGSWVGLNGGGQANVPKNSIGEVLGNDLGLVNVYFAGPAEKNGPLEPHGVTVWVWPSQLVRRPDVRPPGPATRRSHWQVSN